MSQFIVSARKYRPTLFEEVVGQEHVTNTLKNALKSNHLAHAFLFCGPRGVGKTTCARILAKTVNCHEPTADFNPCGKCPSCLSFQNSQSFNIHELDAASNNSVDDIRALVEQVRYAPQGAQYKIYIIDEVHMLSTAAFNAFLKTLEEPPEYAIFILATTEKHKIIPTILSRCQIFDFRRVSVDRIKGHLNSICDTEKIEADPKALHVIAQKADGSVRDSLSIFDRMVSFSGDALKYEDVITTLNILDYEYFFKATDLLLATDTAGILLLLDEVLSNGFEAEQFVGGLAEHFRNILVAKDPNSVGLLQVSEDVELRYKNQAHLTSDAFLLNALRICADCEVQYRSSKNKRLLVEIALLKICHVLQELKLSLDSVEKKSLA